MTIRLTMAQALVRALCVQMTDIGGERLQLFGGVWAIFGHGNVAGMGEALHELRDTLPTFRAHSEQGMAFAAVAYAKTARRRRMMAVTTSIGPGATNLVTAAALAHVNRLPVLLLPGDVFARRGPDPVLQQLECFGDGTVSANDCLRPVSRYFDRLTQPEQLVPAFYRAMETLTDPATCGPVTLALCQDAQAEAWDFPDHLFEERLWTMRRPTPDPVEVLAAAAMIRAARKPLVVCGGGVLYSQAERELAAFCETHGIPSCETQAGKSAMPDLSPLNMGAVGVTGTAAANGLAEQADLVLAVGTRLADFTTGSWALFRDPSRRIVGLNISAFDAVKHRAQPVVSDIRRGLAALTTALAGWRAPAEWTANAASALDTWRATASRYTAAGNAVLPSDAQVIGCVQRQSRETDVVVCAAGGLPGELNKHWRAGAPGGYHAEYGFSTMGYEIAGALGVKMADPSRDVFVLVGDGSYLMLNSEIATSVMLGLKLNIVLLDNRGFGCIDRLQRACGGAGFNNLLADSRQVEMPQIDFVGHARSLGAIALKAANLGELSAALDGMRGNDRTSVVVIDTDAGVITDAGGAWWDVAVPAVSSRPEVRAARQKYERALQSQRVGD